jgi:hypothetical protein
MCAQVSNAPWWAPQQLALQNPPMAASVWASRQVPAYFVEKLLN